MRHLLDLLNFCPGDVVVMDARADTHGTVQRLTRDHSLVQQEIDAGLITAEEALHSRYSHLVTRALGVTSLVEPELTHWPLHHGDRIMLCSDGLTDMLDDDFIESLFAEEPLLSQLLPRLIAAANAAGGKDNISIVLMEADAKVMIR